MSTITTDACGSCGLMLTHEVRHPSPGSCIRALREALLTQKKLAESMAFDISTRYLAVLEELALRPDVGIPYSIRHPGDAFAEPSITLHHQQVSGVFTAIVRKYQELGDWSPLKERDEQIKDLRKLVGAFLAILVELLTPHAIRSIGRRHLDQLKEIEELATRLGVPLPDLRDC